MGECLDGAWGCLFPQSASGYFRLKFITRGLMPACSAQLYQDCGSNCSGRSGSCLSVLRHLSDHEFAAVGLEVSTMNTPWKLDTSNPMILEYGHFSVDDLGIDPVVIIQQKMQPCFASVCFRISYTQSGGLKRVIASPLVCLSISGRPFKSPTSASMSGVTMTSPRFFCFAKVLTIWVFPMPGFPGCSVQSFLHPWLPVSCFPHTNREERRKLVGVTMQLGIVCSDMMFSFCLINVWKGLEFIQGLVLLVLLPRSVFDRL